MSCASSRAPSGTIPESQHRQEADNSADDQQQSGRNSDAGATTGFSTRARNRQLRWEVQRRSDRAGVQPFWRHGQPLRRSTYAVFSSA